MLPSKNTSFCSFSPKMFREPELLKGILHYGLISGSGISPEGGDATHSSILAWRIPWKEEAGRLQSMGLQRVRYDWSDLACMHLTHRTSAYWHFTAVNWCEKQSFYMLGKIILVKNCPWAKFMSDPKELSTVVFQGIELVHHWISLIALDCWKIFLGTA